MQCRRSFPTSRYKGRQVLGTCKWVWLELSDLDARMASSASSPPATVLGTTTSDETGDGSKMLSVGPQVAQQIPFQVCTS